MPIKKAIRHAKRRFRNTPVYNTLISLLGVLQSAKIAFGERKARSQVSNLVTLESLLDTSTVLSAFQRNLQARAVVWPPAKKKGELHIVYASFPSIWEEINIPSALEEFGCLSCYFTRDRGIDIANRSAARRAIDTDFPAWVSQLHERHPVDLVVTYFSGAEISAGAVERVKELGIPIATFHWDDRLHFFGRKIGNQWSGPAAVCKNYDLNLTNSPDSLFKYKAAGALAIFWPEAANPRHFAPRKEQSFDYEVSFIGARYGVRERLVSYLRANGVKVATFGPGWPDGLLTDDEMLSVYHRSRINLGFGYVGFSKYQCLKGRDFEVPSCGVVYLTSDNPDLHRVFEIGSEIVTYKDFQDCLEKIRQLLDAPELCDRLRTNSRQRVLAEHTWAHRFDSLFDRRNYRN